MRPIRLLAVLLACCFAAPTGAAEPEVALMEVTVKQFEEQLRRDFAGKVVVVDVWFLGCDPCKKKFPEMVALGKKLRPKNVVLASLDIMSSELPNKDKVLAFLKKQSADGPNYIFTDGEEATDAFMERAKFSVTPAVLIFDAKGELVKTLENPKITEVEAAIEKLITK